MDLIALAIPAFFGLMIAEMVYARRRRPAEYRFADTIANLACGTGEQIIVATTSAGLLFYDFLETRYGLYEFDSGSPGVWVGTFVAVDFLYYWFHRSSHRVNLLWAAHAVHHQSEHYNLSVALRQSWIQHALSIPYYLPLALIGVPLSLFATCYVINLLYQFWIHTPFIARLGPLEAILNTPSHHRVHHGADPIYLDRNHAGVFIVWDRLFGTYQPEVQTPRYGTVKPVRRWNVLAANLQPWRDLWAKARRAPRPIDRLRLWFAPPEWVPPGSPPETAMLRTDPGYALYDARLPRPRSGYALACFLVALAASVVYLTQAESLPWAPRVALAVLLVGALTAIGAWFDRGAPASPPSVRPTGP